MFLFTPLFIPLFMSATRYRTIWTWTRGNLDLSAAAYLSLFAGTDSTISVKQGRSQSWNGQSWEQSELDQGDRFSGRGNLVRPAVQSDVWLDADADENLAGVRVDPCAGRLLSRRDGLLTLAAVQEACSKTYRCTSYVWMDGGSPPGGWGRVAWLCEGNVYAGGEKKKRRLEGAEESSLSTDLSMYTVGQYVGAYQNGYMVKIGDATYHGRCTGTDGTTGTVTTKSDMKDLRSVQKECTLTSCVSFIWHKSETPTELKYKAWFCTNDIYEPSKSRSSVQSADKTYLVPENGGFETGTDNTFPSGWMRYASYGTSGMRSTSISRSGSASIKFSGPSWELIENGPSEAAAFQLAAGVAYTLVFYARSTDAGQNVR